MYVFMTQYSITALPLLHYWHSYVIATQMELNDFCISSKTGFLPPQPVKALQGDYFSEWEKLVQGLRLLIRDKCVKRAVEDLPEVEFSDRTLSTEEEWQRAYVILSFIAHSFIFETRNASESSESPVVLPSKVAVQWLRTAEYVGVPPAATYAAVVLYNYAIADPKKPLNADNLKTSLTFTGSSEESWFYIVHVLEELAATTGLNSIISGYSAMADKDNKSLGRNLKVVAATLCEMKSTLRMIKTNCSAKFYLFDLLPFVDFPECGVIYDGVSSEVKHYRSASGAQDSAIPAFSIFLGIKYGKEERETLDDFSLYMPAKHRDFLTTLSKQPSVKLYVEESRDSELIQCYDEAVSALTTFRSDHIRLVTSYVINAQRLHGEPTTEADKSSGAAPFMKFLKNVRDNTKS